MASKAEVVWLPLLVYAVVVMGRAAAEISSFPAGNVSVTGDASNALLHLAVDTDTGQVFVGAVNSLFQLDGDLQLLAQATTGPAMDNPDCIPPYDNKTSCTSSSKLGQVQIPKQQLNNANMILIVDNVRNNVIACGSLYQGTCQLRNRTDISVVLSSYDTSADQQYFVAANDPTLSTVAYLGYGPGGVGSGTVLYTAASINKAFYSARGTYAVASRLLNGPRTFFTWTSFDSLRLTGTYLSLPPTLPVTYTYKAGFFYQNYSYFIAQSVSSLSNSVVSKIARICQYDDMFGSYIDMPLTCSSSNFNSVTAATVFTGTGYLATMLGASLGDGVLLATFTSQQSAGGVVCAYAINNVTNNLNKNILQCLQGTTTTGDLFGSKSCAPYQLRTTFSCENPYIQSYPPISGSLPLSGFVLHNSTSSLTAVSVDVVANVTVLFLGTSDGHLIKVYVDNNGPTAYDDILLDSGVSVNADIMFSPSRLYIYLSTPRRVYKVPVETCSSLLTPQSCLAMSDPYCGWCTLENRCSRASNCSNSAQPLRWLSSLGSLTFDLVSIDRRYLSVLSLSTQQVRLQFTSLPPIQSPQLSLVCQFMSGQARAVSMATVSNFLVTCPMPTNVSSLLRNADHFDVQLSLISMETQQAFYSTVVTFYNCSSLALCSQCTQTPYGCQWCNHDNRCRDSATSCLMLGAVSSVQSCPMLVSTAPISTLIPAAVSTRITIRAANLPSPQSGEGYQCSVQLGSTPIIVPATYVNTTTLVCAPTAYSYSLAVATLTAPLSVIWNGNYMLETNTTIQVLVYQCALLASDCSTCVSLLSASEGQYNCAWCTSTNTCSNIPTCQSTGPNTCPAPTVTSVHPTSGPVDGNTPITIQGTNLGSSPSTVKVAIGSIPCNIVDYTISKQVVCRTSAVARELNASVTVTVGDITVNVAMFYYRNPRVMSIYPTRGPLSGGTLLTVSGMSLNTGSTIDISLGGLPCNLVSVADSQLTCRTSDGGTVINTRTKLIVTFDGSPRKLDITYDYVNDPVLFNISPLSSITSGGRNITIDGMYLDDVLQPMLALLHNGRVVNSTVCQVISSAQLQCESPAVPLSTRRRRQSVAVTGSVYTLSLIMDAVKCTQNISACYANVSSQFTVYPDPVFDPFTGGTLVLSGQLLGLTGHYLNLASTLAETSVLIGQEACVLKSMDDKSLYCIAPSSQPSGLASDGTLSAKILPVVTVSVGNMRAVLGTLQYQTSGSNDYWIIIVAVLGGVLIVFAFLVFIIVMMQRRKAASRYKKMQIQLDTLESNVRNECKQAFAELQTDVSDLTSDLSLVGIPFWDFRTYMFKVLFPGSKDHPILHNRNVSMMTQFGSYSQGLSQFNQLLCHKTFLVTFIHTLEQQQRDFTIKDKACVASLLTVILLDKMEYATEILTILLTELIDRSMEKKQPKLMLRRMESVVEKFLANWMSVCLYGHLKKQAGKSLFMLNKAIKHQTEKGPIDTITADARYSLSEDKLLREKIEPKTLLVTLAKGHDHDTVQCRLLDCDTISQAKEKALDAIYLNIPASRRPPAHSRDLVWRRSGNERVKLQDEDQHTMRQYNGYKQLNTLATYGLRDGAVLALVTRTEPDDMVTGRHGEIELSDVNAPIIKLAEDGLKVWHLVKPDDSGHHMRDRTTNNNNNNNNKVISEIFLTRLLTTKMTLQQYIDDVFLCILRADGSLPPAIKYIFDFFDAAARRHGVTDADIVHTWKSNSLLLRFWVNIIKNPEFVFDMNKSTIVDSCLSVIAQTFMDSCSTAEHRLGKDSPSNKLLFAKDIPRYRQQVSQFYMAVYNAPPVTDQDMEKLMTELSMANSVDFNVSVALTELYKYARKYRFELAEALEDSVAARKLQLASHFEQVLGNIEELSVLG